MKYMGSKNTMLKNGLGTLLQEQCPKSNRFFDLFCGSAVVSWFVGERTNAKVLSYDLQTYSYFLSQSIIGRTKALSLEQLNVIHDWILSANNYIVQYGSKLQFKSSQKFVLENRRLSSLSSIPLVKAYGGHYFSYDQILVFNYLMENLPEDKTVAKVAMAALIESASSCAASPGHTAQPFQPKGKGLLAIIDVWKKDPLEYLFNRIPELSNRFANKKGYSYIGDAGKFLNDIEEGDLVFLDPPYSGVHYSRFYHVLESIARRKITKVSGVGRYPSPQQRPTSDYSMRTKSASSLNTLFKKISAKKAKAIITYPNNECSNGLSGAKVKELANLHFKVKKEIIKGKFSTLGGNNGNRPSRHASEELVLLLEPK